MNDINLIDAVERYIRGEMTPDERLYFEQLRKTNPDVDLLVVEHTLFLQQMNRFGEWKKFKQNLHDVHTDLSEQGKINIGNPHGTAKVVYLWRRYKRVVAIAASIAGIVAITISILTNSLAPKPKDPELQKLVHKMNALDQNQKALDRKIKIVDDKSSKRSDFSMSVRFNGTGFLID